MKMLNEDISGHLPLKIDIICAVMITLFVQSVQVFWNVKTLIKLWYIY